MDRNSRFSHHDEEDQDAVEGVRWFALRSWDDPKETDCDQNTGG